MEPDCITITGAREHNLKGVTVSIPKKRLVVFSGPSGSGKSSLAFDTLYAEGQRRYVESLSSYARQFLGQMQKPHYDAIRGLSPTISIEQKAASNNPRSTVGTITEITDYLRVLYARAGTQHCPSCGQKVARSSAQAIVHELESLPAGARFLLLAPVIENRKGEFREVLDQLRQDGLVRARVDGEVIDLAATPKLDKRKKHQVEAVVDRLVAGRTDRRRLTDSVETALKLGKGKLVVSVVADGDGGAAAPPGAAAGEGVGAAAAAGGVAVSVAAIAGDRILSENLACEACSISFPELQPQRFSFNSPLGMCAECNGLGSLLDMDPERFVADPSLSINQGAIRPWANLMEGGEGWGADVIRGLAEAYAIDLDAPFADLTPKQRKAIFYGADQRIPVKWQRGRSQGVFYKRWEGLVPAFKRRLLQTQSEEMKTYYQKFLIHKPCGACDGSRLRLESRHVRFGGRTFVEVHELAIAELNRFFAEVDLGATERAIAAELLKEIGGRLRFLDDVGLGYLTLSRAGPSLSGGEAQRIRLASQIGSELTGVIYVLDEPSIGLHQRDNQRLLRTLEHLRDVGNTVIVVEHDLDTLLAADHLIDFGPGAGVRGGEVVAEGPPALVAANERSLTGDYLSGRRRIELPAQRRLPDGRFIQVRGATENNLKAIDVDIPIGLFTCVTGVSGAGKSTLVNHILLPALKRQLNRDLTGTAPGRHREVAGLDALDKVIDIDQQPIGRTPRSNPATYTKLFDAIRDVFAALPHAKMYGYDKGRFSFNVKGGRCEGCEGGGVRCVEMHFLPDVYVTCEECQGRRFNDATLEVRLKGKSIADILDLTVAEARDLFKDHPAVARTLDTLMAVGLDYMKLGQSSTTLSGGEAQRIKLSRELAKRATGRTLYVLDEPSTGLHFEDIQKLLVVLLRLVESGNTVLVIEHNLDIIKVADWVIDIGPEGGRRGGEVIAQGTPETVAAIERSYTGAFLRDLLERAGRRVVAAPRSRAAGASRGRAKAPSAVG